MTFHYTASRIRSKSQWDDDWIEQLFMHLPDDLLHAFACDCAWRALQREEQGGRVAHIQIWELIVAKRKFVRDELNLNQLNAQFERAHAAVGHPQLHVPKSSSLEVAIDAALEAALEDPMEAATGASWAAARSAGIASRDATAFAERTWQLNQLAELCELWGDHGYDALRLHDTKIVDRGR